MYSRWFTWLLTVFVVFFPIMIVPYFDVFYSTLIKYIYLLLFVLVFWVVVLVRLMFKSIEIPLLKSRAEHVMLLFLLLAGVATYFSVDPYTSLWGREYKFLGYLAWVSFASMFFFTYHFIPQRKQLLTIQLIVISSIPVALYGIFQHFWMNLLLEEPIEREFIKSWAFFDNSNHFGTYAMLMLMFLFIVYLMSNQTKYMTMWLMIGVIIFIALLYTSARAGWIGLLAGALVITGFMIIKRRDLLKRWTVMLTALFVTMVIIDFTEDHFVLGEFMSVGEDARQVVEQEPGDAPARWQFWVISVELMAENFWTGTGPSTFNQVYYDAIGVEDGRHDNSHNEFVEVGLTLGVPALMVYVVFLSLIFWKGVSASRVTEGNEQLLTVLLLASVVSYLVKVMFNVSVIPVAPFFFVVLGMIWRRASQAK
ncbi:putative inorganic carbon (HCO3(-)) transporter [Alkalibacillus filiformis]|uniref:Inorganic carbon (HCO3(-)) transporter n=1 Tax=Alkalibacillus filiformis TaxID=200990 RepID=A0ABU0DV92_9BACI|nr:O-antigen ligase family protein [Alkalibacillus filiformis]MDQ0352368.1 putative inorganic carbon (HCO3(-)) transporter [Alkalibacillus filiformis]